eukprot:7520340-Lingulodinium_polyedra.AAC.1
MVPGSTAAAGRATVKRLAMQNRAAERQLYVAQNPPAPDEHRSLLELKAVEPATRKQYDMYLQ